LKCNLYVGKIEQIERKIEKKLQNSLPLQIIPIFLQTKSKEYLNNEESNVQRMVVVQLKMKTS